VQVEAVHQLPDLKRFLKLYTSVTTEKLAQLLDCDVDTLLAVLKSMQKRIMQKRWVAGEAIAGQEVATTDIDFKLEKDRESGKDVVVVKEQRVAANHLATLAKHIVRFEQITADMEVHVTGTTMAAAR
jgi:RNA polymerase I-associated factor PAF67